ncbi:MAG: acetyltransferase [Rickettsia endosymbiont of Ixodes persulcatus]|nr:acetyltransferase [Rickettsia endosymbiont of Ixodes persulcatus]
MKRLIIVGKGRMLEQACETARDNGLNCLQLELNSSDQYNFDTDPLFENYTVVENEVFVALDERAINYARHKLIAKIRLAGYRLFNIVSSRAIVNVNIQLLGNVYIGPGCNIAQHCIIGMGSWLDRQVIVEDGSRLGVCTTLMSGVQLGWDVEIGQGSTLGSGCIASAKTKVGRHCEWLLPGMLPKKIPDHSFYDQLMPQGACILD